MSWRGSLAARKTPSRRLRRPAGEGVRLRRPLSLPFGADITD
ncbi:hypothetical protein [Serratia ureilytica]|nr:hypothetical protein [Serratia ureilytica]